MSPGWLLLSRRGHCQTHRGPGQCHHHYHHFYHYHYHQEVTVDMLTQLDRLVQLLESPIFTFLRMEVYYTDVLSSDCTLINKRPIMHYLAASWWRQWSNFRNVWDLDAASPEWRIQSRQVWSKGGKTRINVHIVICDGGKTRNIFILPLFGKSACFCTVPLPLSNWNIIFSSGKVGPGQDSITRLNIIFNVNVCDH